MSSVANPQPEGDEAPVKPPRKLSRYLAQLNIRLLPEDYARVKRVMPRGTVNSVVRDLLMQHVTELEHETLEGAA